MSRPFTADIRDSVLPSMPKLVLMSLASRAGTDSRVFPSLETLAQDISASVSTAQRHVRWLRDRGILQVESGRESGRSNRYGPRRDVLEWHHRDLVPFKQLVAEMFRTTGPQGAKAVSDALLGVSA